MLRRERHPALNRMRRTALISWMRVRQAGRSKNGRAILAASATLVLLTLLRASNPWIVAEIKERTFDAYQRLKPRAQADLPIHIVDLDEASLAAFGQWPWPRTRLAALTRRLQELGAGVIAFDILFSEPDRTTPSRLSADLRDADVPDLDLTVAMLSRLPDHDKVFAETIARGSVVLGFAATAANDKRPLVRAGLAFVGAKPTDVLAPFRGAITNIDVLDQAAAGVGALNLSASDRGGVVRRIPMLLSDGERIYPGLAVEALRVAQGKGGLLVRSTGSSGDQDTGKAALLDMRVGDFKVPLTDIGESWLYFNHDRPERYVSAKDVLDLAKDVELRSRFDGAIVLIGTSAAGLLDSRATPLGEIMPGVAIHAQLIEQIVTQDFLERPDWANGLEILLTVVFGALVAALVLGFGARFSLIAGGLVAVAAIAGSWLAFSHLRLLLDPLYPSMAALATYVAVERVLHRASDQEKKFVRQAFGQYLAPALLEQLEKSPDAMRLGGDSRDITVMFMDVRGFTPISETLSATELVDFINTLLAPLSDAIQDELGTIDKYIGDSIMAFWNAPVDVAAHQVCACRAALKMRLAVAELNARDAFGFRARGFPDPEVRIGVGLNSGIACVGNMGSQKRFNYSAMGDVVNVAARIESTTKNFHTDLLVSEDVANNAGAIALLEAGELLLKGKSVPTKVYAIAGDETLGATAEFAELRRLHGGLTTAIANRDAPAALTALQACRALTASTLVFEKIHDLYDYFEIRIADFAPARPRLPVGA